MELIENLSTLENVNSNNPDHHDHIMVFSGDGFSDQQQQQVQHHNHHLLPMNFTDNIQSFSHSDNHEDPRTVLLDHSMLLSSDQSGSPIKKEKRLGGRKRKVNNEKVVEKPKEVIHVRAKRGQATDSHSLAERARREKINERLRCLQNLVPGCYKTMGMAVMLDVVISYVQSLQSQIEFLSMKLSAASMFYDFNSPNMDALETVPGTNIAYEEEQEMEKMAMMREGYGGLSYLHS
ncbi:hypothetical protein FNV43_RR26624 [Rhamnella rubrinervis]|uniref:BHLH domain-containing protein n=1 Tax=Rhamnella rubrinervis TaxID=2594499 RepID=A0A8K0DMX3_9ROSA|nr:hypothetical protein FNV43_RR26624 [Rhamnella rubrinervis]